jgi:hypothetical protein
MPFFSFHVHFKFSLIQIPELEGDENSMKVSVPLNCGIHVCSVFQCVQFPYFQSDDDSEEEKENKETRDNIRGVIAGLMDDGMSDSDVSGDEEEAVVEDTAKDHIVKRELHGYLKACLILAKVSGIIFLSILRLGQKSEDQKCGYE